MLLLAVTPALRRRGTEDATRALARRFGIGSVVALLALVATGIPLASRHDRWDDGVLHAKLVVLLLVLALVALHVVRPRTRGLSYVLVGASLLLVWLGVELAH